MAVLQTRRHPLATLAASAAAVAATTDLREALETLTGAAREAVDADLAVLRVLDADGSLAARTVAPDGSALAAEVAGTRASVEDAARGLVSAAVARAAERAHAAGTLAVAVRADGRVVGALELLRIASRFDEEEQLVAALAAAQVGLALRTLTPETSASGHGAAWLELAGEALAAGGDVERSARQTVRIAVQATGARAGALWQVGEERQVELQASVGALDGVLDRAAELAREAAASLHPVSCEHDSALPADASAALALPLGQPPLGVLQLFYEAGMLPSESGLAALGAFAARAAHALRTGERIHEVELELVRTRALLAVVGEAISRLSLTHTLETAVERVGELLQVDHVGIYLRDESGLQAAAGRGIVAGHDALARAMLDVLQGPLRARTALRADAAGGEPALAGVRAALRATRQPAAVAVALRVADETIGLLVAYLGARTLTESEQTLLEALAVQLATAVQNARLHERSNELFEERSAALASAQEANRRLAALYQISGTFTESLSLERTLDAVTATIVDVLSVDAAVLRMPDERGDAFVPRSLRVAEPRLASALGAILFRPQPRAPRNVLPAMLDAAAAHRLGGAHALLVPFLDQGSTAAVVPVVSKGELLAQLTIVSVDPASQIDEVTLAAARTIAQQAALAIENARLYQQQKQFAETMQQSLLPREAPVVGGLEVGRRYESAAQVDVGGDVFDFLELPDGRLAVVLGDVTGHGIDATADMAMAKFVFRSLAREHPDPSDFLAHANDVVVGELAASKFITMVYVALDPRGEVLCACAGHPEPRLVHPGGRVEPLECRGLALGIDAPQRYEQVRATLVDGGSVVLYTDGVIEARTSGELFGRERLDATLSANAERPAQAIADSVVAACRGFAGGQLDDDCAIVVIKKRPTRTAS